MSQAWNLWSVIWHYGACKYSPLLGWSWIPELSPWSMAFHGHLDFVTLRDSLKRDLQGSSKHIHGQHVSMHLSFMQGTRALPRPTKQRSLRSQAEPNAQTQLLEIRALRFVETSHHPKHMLFLIVMTYYDFKICWKTASETQAQCRSTTIAVTSMWQLLIAALLCIFPPRSTDVRSKSARRPSVSCRCLPAFQSKSPVHQRHGTQHAGDSPTKFKSNDHGRLLICPCHATSNFFCPALGLSLSTIRQR